MQFRRRSIARCRVSQELGGLRRQENNIDRWSGSWKGSIDCERAVPFTVAIRSRAIDRKRNVGALFVTSSGWLRKNSFHEATKNDTRGCQANSAAKRLKKMGRGRTRGIHEEEVRGVRLARFFLCSVQVDDSSAHGGSSSVPLWPRNWPRESTDAPGQLLLLCRIARFLSISSVISIKPTFTVATVRSDVTVPRDKGKHERCTGYLTRCRLRPRSTVGIPVIKQWIADDSATIRYDWQDSKAFPSLLFRAAFVDSRSE